MEATIFENECEDTGRTVCIIAIKEKEYSMNKKTLKGLIYYYSSTGNTKLAAEYIASNLRGIDFEFVDAVKAEKRGGGPKYQADFVGFATYTDKLSAPKFFKNFIKKLPVAAGIKAFVFNTCGLFTGRTVPHLKKAAEEKGFEVIGGYSIKAPENHPVFISMGFSGEDSPSAEEKEGLDRFISRLQGAVDSISQGKIVEKYPYNAGFVNSILPPIPGAVLRFALGRILVQYDACSGCGKCKTLCPVGAITMKENRPEISHDKCNRCYACFNRCSKDALYNEKNPNIPRYGGPKGAFLEKMKKNTQKLLKK